MAWRPVDRINALNVGLMLGSAGVAWVAPFELFLLAYAILGPLHYLTEISWLHDRGYFAGARAEVLVLGALGVLDGVARYTDAIAWDGAVVVAFALALAFAVPARPGRKLALGASAVAVALALGRGSRAGLALAVLLPTVIHVSCFTGIFILHGSLRSRSGWGYVSLGVFVACGVGLLAWQPAAGHYGVHPRTPPLVEQFGPVIEYLLALSGGGGGWDALVAVGRFLGFAYTYHYLNWFSKTGIIRWHAVTRSRLATIGGAWVAAVALYAYDYHVGLGALLVLSVLHVVLEFPLDVQTMATLAAARRAP